MFACALPQALAVLKIRDHKFVCQLLSNIPYGSTPPTPTSHLLSGSALHLSHQPHSPKGTQHPNNQPHSPQGPQHLSHQPHKPAAPLSASSSVLRATAAPFPSLSPTPAACTSHPPSLDAVTTHAPVHGPLAAPNLASVGSQSSVEEQIGSRGGAGGEAAQLSNLVGDSNSITSSSSLSSRSHSSSKSRSSSSEEWARITQFVATRMLCALAELQYKDHHASQWLALHALQV